MQLATTVLDAWRDYLQKIKKFQNQQKEKITSELGFQNLDERNAYWFSEYFEDRADTASVMLQNPNPYSAPRFYLADHSEVAESYRLAKKVDQIVGQALRCVLLGSQLSQEILLQLSKINQFLIQEAMPKLREFNEEHHWFLSRAFGPEQGPLGDILKDLRNWVRDTIRTLTQQLEVPTAAVAGDGLPAEGVVVPMGYQQQSTTPRLFSATVARDQSARAEQAAGYPRRSRMR